MAGRPRDTLVLTDEERATLLRWTRSRTCAQARALRAQIVLACADEPTNTAVAQRLDISRDMVGKWRARFLADRLDGLTEQPRPGRPTAADDDTVAHVLVRALTPPPGARNAWSTRSLAAETGLSQSTVSRIWRTYRVQPGPRAAGGPRAVWSLPDHVERVVGLFLAPPVCVLAVTVRTGHPPTADGMFEHGLETPHVLAVACAFAQLRGNGAARPDAAALRAFLQRAELAAGSGTRVHLLTCGAPDEVDGSARWHHAPGPRAWIGETRRVLVRPAEFARERVSGPLPLRDGLLTWCSTWTPATAAFAWTAAPRPRYAIPAICGPDGDSPAAQARAVRHPDTSATPETTPPVTSPGAPITTDPLVGLLREELVTGPYQFGERVRETPLAVRFGVARRSIRAALRALADEGMLVLLPSGATAIPAITAKDVLDLYALRATLGALLIRRVAMLGPQRLASVAVALAEVRAAARNSDHTLIREEDLRFQDALARIADLPQAARTFEHLTARLRMIVNVLHMDYGPARELIADEDTAVFEALYNADGNEAARLWRMKIERCVRYMIARLPEDDLAPQLWTTLAGRPRLRPADSRAAAGAARPD